MYVEVYGLWFSVYAYGLAETRCVFVENVVFVNMDISQISSKLFYFFNYRAGPLFRRRKAAFKFVRVRVLFEGPSVRARNSTRDADAGLRAPRTDMEWNVQQLCLFLDTLFSSSVCFDVFWPEVCLELSSFPKKKIQRVLFRMGARFGCSGTVDGLIVGVCAAAWGSSRLRILGWFLPKSNLERDFESWEIRRRMRMSDISRLVRRFEGSFFFSFFSLEVCWFAGWLVVWFFPPVADWSWDDLGVLIICTVGKVSSSSSLCSVYHGVLVIWSRFTPRRWSRAGSVGVYTYALCFSSWFVN